MPKRGKRQSRFIMARNERVFEVSQKTWNRNRESQNILPVRETVEHL